ncbi:hypothetical protein BDR07DRAFT_1010814 [Suillus spraguei]|nr:hypothetical protein BDR07DRAFT_1010814 [Suillus spraguei]
MDATYRPADSRSGSLRVMCPLRDNICIKSSCRNELLDHHDGSGVIQKLASFVLLMAPSHSMVFYQVGKWRQSNNSMIGPRTTVLWTNLGNCSHQLRLLH